jgi:hypothetical protein
MPEVSQQLFLGTEQVFGFQNDIWVAMNPFTTGALALPYIRPDANSGSISLAMPFNYFVGSFGMTSTLSDISDDVRGSGTPLATNLTGSGAMWATSSFVNSTGSGYTESISQNGQRYPAWPGNSAPFSFGTGDVTIEAYVNVSANSFNWSLWKHPVSLQLAWQSGTSRWRLVLETPPAGGPQQVIDSSVVTFTAGQWYHLAFVRKGSGTNNCAVWWNGVRITQGTNTFNLGADVVYPARFNDDNIGTGIVRMQDYRIYKGAAVYDPANATITPQGSIVINS